MENTHQLWRAPGFRRNTQLLPVELLGEAEKGDCVLIYAALFLRSASISALSTTVRCCETSIWCLLLWLTSLWFCSLLKRILSCQVNLQGLGCSRGPLVGIQTIPHFTLANVSRGQLPCFLQNQCCMEGNSSEKEQSDPECPSVPHPDLVMMAAPCEHWAWGLEKSGAAWVPSEGLLGMPCQRAGASHCCCHWWRLKWGRDAK